LTGESANTFVQCLVGRKLVLLERMEFSWLFKFEDVATLTTECPWRIITRVGISLASPDNGQSFGRQTAIDAQAEAERLVLGKSIHRAIVRDDTGDLVLDFGDGLLLEALNTSAGFEAWHLNRPEGRTLICGSGGKLQVV
jgi:hypothetical protein